MNSQGYVYIIKQYHFLFLSTKKTIRTRYTTYRSTLICTHNINIIQFLDKYKTYSCPSHGSVVPQLALPDKRFWWPSLRVSVIKLNIFSKNTLLFNILKKISINLSNSFKIIVFKIENTTYWYEFFQYI